ncbi:hypothetical protein [Streptomyces sp. WAC06614]|uniref:hypothetical protein n=1 Tax=Streptomyces sp. WAC06614 TaxID=2487416 RepID=UPI000F798208|nr:hypothetical protein [Streptomyces sp. WAC06614]RSS78741.1 hypothetical protein EF918_19780 [Streptomyces sp. WAC06614]
MHIDGAGQRQRGHVLLIAGDAAVRRRAVQVAPSANLAALAVVPPELLLGSQVPSDTTYLDGARDPNTLLMRLRAAAATAGPLLIYLSGRLTLDRRGRRLHLALAGTTASSVRYTALPWEWLATELRGRPAGLTTIVLDLAADRTAWPVLQEQGTAPLTPPATEVYGVVVPPAFAGGGEAVSTYTRHWIDELRRVPNRPANAQLHAFAVGSAALPPGALVLPSTRELASSPAPGRGPAGFVPEASRYGPAAHAPSAAQDPERGGARSAHPHHERADAGSGFGAAAPRDGARGADAPSVGVPVGEEPWAGGAEPAADAPPPGTQPEDAKPDEAVFAGGPSRTSDPTPRADTATLAVLPQPPLPPLPPLPPTAGPGTDPRPHIHALATSGQHPEAATLAREWEDYAIQTCGRTSPEATHWREIRADLARMAEDHPQATRLWISAGRTRLARQPSDATEVLAAAAGALYCWTRIADPDEAAEAGPDLLSLLQALPTLDPELLTRVERRLEVLARTVG